MAELSPAAQAVLDAAYSELDYVPQRHVRWCAAAALRAAAEWVITDNSGGSGCCINTCEAVHADILAIATELENHQ